MTETLYREHTARHDYECGRECGDPIHAGTRYAVASLPPRSDIGNDRWLTMRVHGTERSDCPRWADQ